MIFWCLWTWESEQDFILDDADIDHLPTLYVQDDVRFEYNQANQTRSQKSCTIFSAIWMASDLMNYEFSLDEIKEIDDLSYKNWRLQWYWRSTKSAIHLVYKRRNSNAELVKKYWKIAYYRISKYSDRLDDILQKKYNKLKYKLLRVLKIYLPYCTYTRWVSPRNALYRSGG